MMRVGDLDLLQFDLDDDADEEAAVVERLNVLVVPPRPPTPEMLAQLEGQYRASGLPAVQFIEDDDNGQSFFGNALEYAKAMKLPPDIMPTMEQADAWVASRRWPAWTW